MISNAHYYYYYYYIIIFVIFYCAFEVLNIVGECWRSLKLFKGKGVVEEVQLFLNVLLQRLIFEQSQLGVAKLPMGMGTRNYPTRLGRVWGFKYGDGAGMGIENLPEIKWGWGWGWCSKPAPARFPETFKNMIITLRPQKNGKEKFTSH
jgi:hypothetical protein